MSLTMKQLDEFSDRHIIILTLNERINKLTQQYSPERINKLTQQYSPYCNRLKKIVDRLNHFEGID
jgi:hypothetical protein